MTQLDRQALLDEVSNLADWLMKLSLDGGIAIGSAHLEELRQMAALPATRSVPKMASLLDELGGLIGAYSSNRNARELEALMDKVLDCFYSSRAVKTYLQGKFSDLPALEELFGADRPDRKEERLQGLEALEVGLETRRLDEERVVDVSTLVDLATGQFLSEEVTRHATPTRPSTRRSPRQGKLTAQTCLLAPGFSPRRATLQGIGESPLERADLDRLAAYARPTVEALHKDYRTFRSNFFAPERMPILISPKGFYAEEERIYLVDKAGNLLTLSEQSGNGYLGDRLVARLGGASIVFGNLLPSGGQIVLVVLGAFSADESGQISRYVRA